jgi:CHASE2 domain-containing sensor protein
MEARTRSARRGVWFASLFVVGVVVLLLHGIALDLTPWSQTIINGVVALTYPTLGQRDTTVVLFRERNLRDLREPYPVSYSRHAEVLDALGLYQPWAVFVDFTFLDERDHRERLEEALCSLSTIVRGRLYLAVPPDGDGDAVIRRKFRCGTPVSAVMDQTTGVSGVLTYCHGADGTEECGGRGRAEFLASPAFALAKDRVHDLIPEHEERMEIIWANRHLPENDWMECGRGAPETGLLGRVLRHGPHEAKRECPPNDTVSVAHVLGSYDPDVERLIRGRAIFYGAAFDTASDRVVSPVYQDLPGVYLHAMAYDNLVSFGRHYKRAGGRVVWLTPTVVSISRSLVADLTLLLAIVVVIVWGDDVARRVQGWIGAKWSAAAAVGFTAAGVGIWLVPAAPAGVFMALLTLLATAAWLAAGAGPPPASGGAPRSPDDFMRKTVGEGIVLMVVAPIFALASYRLRIEFSLLLALAVYIVARVVCRRDTRILAVTTLTVGTAFAVFLPPFDLGPRNIVAYVAFFEVAERAREKVRRLGEEYARLGKDSKAWGGWRWLRGMTDWLFG